LNQSEVERNNRNRRALPAGTIGWTGSGGVVKVCSVAARTCDWDVFPSAVLRSYLVEL